MVIALQPLNDGRQGLYMRCGKAPRSRQKPRYNQNGCHPDSRAASRGPTAPTHPVSLIRSQAACRPDREP